MNTEKDEERIWSIIEVREVADEVLREFFFDKEMPSTICIRYIFYGSKRVMGSFSKKDCTDTAGNTRVDYIINIRYSSMTRTVLRILLIHELCHAYVSYNDLDSGKDHHRKAWRILAKEMTERSGYVIQKYATVEEMENYGHLECITEAKEFYDWYHADLDYIGDKLADKCYGGVRVFPPKTRDVDFVTTKV